MKKAQWLVDDLLTERAYETGYPSIEEVCKELGYSVYKTKYIPFSTEPDPNIPYGTFYTVKDCVITHGTVQFCKQIQKFYGNYWLPGLYFNDNVKSFEKFAAHLGPYLLNDDFFILPWAEVVRRDCRGFFVKPLSGMKEFTGQVIEDFRDITDVSGGFVNPETLCVVSTPKKIDAEFRYVIVEGKVITGSEYRWDNILDVRRDTLPEADTLAKTIAELEWQADKVYVCDIAMHGGKPYVIELNAFSSSGFYACDTYKIVEAVSKAAENEFIDFWK